VQQILLFEPGWRSGYRAGLEIQKGIEVGKPASGPLARRGSNPFPGAVFQRFLRLFWQKKLVLTLNHIAPFYRQDCACFFLVEFSGEK
jgi:hypothetical protein